MQQGCGDGQQGGGGGVMQQPESTPTRISDAGHRCGALSDEQESLATGHKR